MTQAFRTEATTTADPEQVWAVLTDWDRAPEWMAGVEALRAEGPTAPGTDVVFRARGKERPSRITAVDEGRRVVLRSSQGPVTAEYAYELEPADGGTRVVLTAGCDVRGPMGLLAPLVRRTLARTDGGQPAALAALVDGGR